MQFKNARDKFMEERFSRTELLLGSFAMEKLARSRVAIFGVGGVGGYAVEALARSGVGKLTLIDNDKVNLSNINRQIIATDKTIGQYKVDALKERILSINPDCEVKTYKTFFLPETADIFDFTEYDYVIDAIDTITGKLEIIKCSKAAGVPVISSMGAGNKLDPTAFTVADIYKTSVCPLAKVMRTLCRKNGIESLKVVYSKEPPKKPENGGNTDNAASCISEEQTEKTSAKKRAIPGSTAFVPPVVGLIIASEVIKDITSK